MIVVVCSAAALWLSHVLREGVARAEPPWLQTANEATSPASEPPIELVQFTHPLFGGGDSAARHVRPADGFANAGYGPGTPFGQGGVYDPPRMPWVAAYRLRVHDEIELIYRRTRTETSRPYQLNVGDTFRFELMGEPDLTRELIVQSDGTIAAPYIGPVRATRHTVDELRAALVERYKRIYKQPEVTLTPIQLDTKLVDIINTVDSRAGFGGQRTNVNVMPDGLIAVVPLGSVPAQGLTIEELKRELNERLTLIVEGLEIQPVLKSPAQRLIYVLGEVAAPKEYPVDSPTTVVAAIARAGGVTSAVTANLRQVVVLRRDEHFRVRATILDLYEPVIRGNVDCRYDDVWLSDGDVVIIPKTKIRIWNEWINAVFTQGVYGVIPFSGVNLNYAKLSTL